MSVESIDEKVLAKLKKQLQAVVLGVDDHVWDSCLELSLSAFNSHDHCTYFSLADKEFCDYFSNILVTYAIFLALNNFAYYENWKELIKIKETKSFKEEWEKDND